MASISKDKKGNRTIQFKASDGKRRSIRLGKMPHKAAELIKTKVEAINASLIAQISIDKETADWVSKLDTVLYRKLTAVGLVPPRITAEQTSVIAFIDDYLVKRTDIKNLTRRNLKQVRNDLERFFGLLKPLAEVTEGDADDFRQFLKKTVGENTVRRRCGMARQFFRAAVRRRLIPSNPFGDMKGIAVQANPSRFYFISRSEAQAVLNACPDAQWRLLFALARFGGLRTPSETLALRWEDVNWAKNRMTIRSSKTEHHEGKASRIIPIFPELEPHLKEVSRLAEPQSDFVITRYRDSNSNLRTQLGRIIKKAGLTRWPKLFQNLRSTRQTELAEIFPAHVVCDWIGNSEAVARKHYLQVTDEHFQAASKVAMQNPVQQPAEQPEVDRNEPHDGQPSL